MRHSRWDSFMPDELMTVDEVAAMLKVKVSWVYDRIASRHPERLPHIRLGRYVRFERAAVLEFVQHQRKAYAPFLRRA
jgi:excisionase family DNA binding protein